jgi:hypothetical protein
MNTLIAFVLTTNLTVINPFENLDVTTLSPDQKEFVVDQEAKIKNSVASIHDEVK